ncbi:translesion error-prone DNA polymerase V autoproteolytic subunit [Pseudomonas lalucatii]|uniref:Translesion error-prone DNA polymerase V autoproteolytic subunit n=1 Tax=Pseudomonas lalucatii TaxID=1424203 RepID=A0ABS5PVG8_9PSED|nr:translesion error-prone DNA polymerase V autoproteolytic subunit [Pseudomonas lalucatii]MBS7660542.1 translesion error-prone DNA polymerase V autoproteolytic subunit [Pseudomonas lalucatii]
MALTVIGRCERPGLRLPLFLSRIAAGFPSPAEDHIEANLSLDELCVRHPASTYFLRVAGDSMTGLGIFDGDTLVVDRALKPQAGMVVVAIVRGDFTCKQLAFEQGLPLLKAANPSYPDIRLREDEELEVFGVVTNCIHKLPVF